jgi:transposase
VVPFKVRRRAQAVRLAAQGRTAPRIARHLGLDRTTLHRDLRRWPERGIEGLGQRSYLEDGKPPGARPRWTPAMSAFLGELLAGEEAWTAPRLQEALERRFFVTSHPGTVRRKLLEMGYRWKRTRYVPTGKPTAEERGLGYALLEGRCGTGEVVAYLEGLSREVAREGVRGVVFLDNAPFHRSRGFREAVERWRGRGLEVAYLPRYSPHLNPVGQP